MKRTLKHHVLAALIGVAFTAEIPAQVPQILSYQGRMQSQGTNFTGMGQFKFALVDGGVNTSQTARAFASVAGGAVVGFTIIDGGAGYLDIPRVTITGAGTGAAATARIAGGRVVDITVENGGAGYLVPPQVQIAAPPIALRFTSFWSNDGTSVNGEEPAEAVSVPVADGLFTVGLGDASLVSMIPIPVEVFTNAAVHLRIWFGDGSSAYQPLAPDQPLRSAGYAMVAQRVNELEVTTLQLADDAVTAEKLAPGAVAGDTVADGSLSTDDFGAEVSSLFWRTDGNAGLAQGSFLGTRDEQSLEFRVHNQRAFRIVPGSNTVNVIAGWHDNLVTGGAQGATIAGGGRDQLSMSVDGYNSVGADFGAIGGGYRNTASGEAATVAGGRGNRCWSESDFSNIGGGFENEIRSPRGVIGGGSLNEIAANNSHATIGGGSFNRIEPFYGTIAGGRANVVGSDGSYSFIGAGESNQVSGAYSVAMGGFDNRAEDQADYVALGGGEGNTVEGLAHYATIGGGYQNQISGGATHSFIAGGYLNTIHSNATHSLIAGGSVNRVRGSYASVPGGSGNQANGDYSMAAGRGSFSEGDYALALGRGAKANHTGAFVWADSLPADFASTTNNQFLIRASGGVGIGTDNPSAELHVAGPSPSGSFDGQLHLAGTGDNGNAGNGAGLRFSGHDGNIPRDWAYVRGLKENSTVGSLNSQLSIATRSSGGLQERLRISSRGYMALGAFDPSHPIHLASGAHVTAAGVWVDVSDRNAKENFEAVNPRQILDQVAELPITSWNYKAEDQQVRHIGPVAQDFHRSFGVGADDKHLAALDGNGVALAAIQGLNEKVEGGIQHAEVRSRQFEQRLKQKDTEIAQLKQELEKLKQVVDKLVNANQ